MCRSTRPSRVARWPDERRSSVNSPIRQRSSRRSSHRTRRSDCPGRPRVRFTRRPWASAIWLELLDGDAESVDPISVAQVLDEREGPRTSIRHAHVRCRPRSSSQILSSGPLDIETLETRRGKGPRSRVLLGSFGGGSLRSWPTTDRCPQERGELADGRSHHRGIGSTSPTARVRSMAAHSARPGRGVVARRLGQANQTWQEIGGDVRATSRPGRTQDNARDGSSSCRASARARCG